MKHIYHGTVLKDLTILKPLKRYTPGGAELADRISARIYATYNPAYAVAHSFPWSSDDGIDIHIHKGIIELLVPKAKQSVLNQEIYIYTLPDDTFVHTVEEETDLTYHSEVAVKPIHCTYFSNVQDAMTKYVGIIKIV